MQRKAQEWREQGLKIGFVPTMGYLHEGHLSLVDVARSAVGREGKVVVSIYVNPTQFGPNEDLSRYPRDLKRDLSLCRKRGVDVVFVPRDEVIYLKNQGAESSTHVVENSLTTVMEGASRPTHFRGVTTIVTKLFNMVQPHVAVFGSKDYQQAAVIRRMTRDLNFPIKIVVAPTSREADGLARSSRNAYLSESERKQATALWKAIKEARRVVRSGPVAVSRLVAELKSLIEANPVARVDYISVFDPDTLQPVELARKGVHMALAVFVGRTRLIDNSRL